MASVNHEGQQDSFQQKSLVSAGIMPDDEKPNTVDIAGDVDSLVSSFDKERQSEKRFLKGLSQSITAKKNLLEVNLGMIADIVEYADYKSSNMWKHRFKQPTDELSLFQTTTKAMARHLYILENFRQAEIDRLLVKASLHYKEGFEAKNAMNRGILKAIANEAVMCKEREKEVEKMYTDLMDKMSGGSKKGSKKKKEKEKKGQASDTTGWSYQTWEESTQRARLQEAQMLRADAEEAAYLKYHELTKNSMLEFENIYAKIILIEIEFHAKAIEELTGAFQCLRCPMKSLGELDSRPRLKRLLEEKKIFTTHSSRKLVYGDSDGQSYGYNISKANVQRNKSVPRKNQYLDKDSSQSHSVTPERPDRHTFEISFSTDKSDSDSSYDSYLRSRLAPSPQSPTKEHTPSRSRRTSEKSGHESSPEDGRSRKSNKPAERYNHGRVIDNDDDPKEQIPNLSRTISRLAERSNLEDRSTKAPSRSRQTSKRSVSNPDIARNEHASMDEQHSTTSRKSTKSAEQSKDKTSKARQARQLSEEVDKIVDSNDVDF